MSPELYRRVRDWMLTVDPDAKEMLAWARKDLRPPATPDALAREVIWIILCAGRSAQAARTIEKKVLAAIRAGAPVVTAFGYRAKASAIERAWREREQDFAALQQVLARGDNVDLVAWCAGIPFVGEDTKYQLAKNFGVQVCKPDIWMCRLAGIPDRPRLGNSKRFERCQAMAQHLASATGDSVAVVDSILWLACNKSVLRVSFEPHHVEFTAGAPRGRSIYEPAQGHPV